MEQRCREYSYKIISANVVDKNIHEGGKVIMILALVMLYAIFSVVGVVVA